MHTLGMMIGLGVFFLEGLLILRGARSGVFRAFPLFYSYIIYCFGSFTIMYLVYWLGPQIYPSAFWVSYLVTILAEFMVLVEISDHIFRPFPAIRSLGRALTVLISAALGLLYILPTILWPTSSTASWRDTQSSLTTLDFALRASVTKAIILVVLFYVAGHYDSQLGRNVGGLMLGFSVYVAMNIAILASAKAFGSVLYARILWVMGPLASALCVVVWTVSLWEIAPIPITATISTAPARDSQAVALELTRYDSELSKILHK
jgi:hypothetical protein